ncbi:GATA zinc finger domain-containing protein 7 [Drosophila grimshawi]|uniref:GATA zinc finger domain-containing protein 7 n=1 Tax=Drosophila grimshawi TaxID=7222 RepID=UPI000C8701FC|nr:GATA zinc finger domain-containing protein 7 [Drosophila grimshawi]
MVSKTLLLLVAIAAARFGCPTTRTSLALACDESTPALQNNRYSSYYSKSRNSNNNNDYSYNNIDGMVDRSENNADGNNDNYNYNKASAKWLPSQQKLYGNSQEQQQQQQQQLQQQQQQHQRQQQQQQFVDDPEAARNDFLLQLSDLNAAVQGVGMFAATHSSNRKNDNSNSDNSNKSNNNGNDNNVWQADAEYETEEEQLPLDRRSRSNSYMSRNSGQPEQYGNDDPTTESDIDVEGEEDYAVSSNNDADELSDQLPYGIQNVRKRRVRSVMPPAAPQPHGGDGVIYQSLCPTNRVTVKLDNGEYRPNHYVEVTCANNYAPLPARMHNYDFNYRSNELPLLRALLNERVGEKREICSATGFSCIQLNRTIHLIRLNEGSGCWESETRTVPSGCECMWPKHSYGDIASYHQAQKRFKTTLTNLQGHGGAIGNIDYKPGVGYRQLALRSRAPKVAHGIGGGVRVGSGAGGTRSRRADADYDIYELN